MTRHARHGSAALEFLLDEDVPDGTRLGQVLTAARQPAHAEEFAGLAQARAAFVSTFAPEIPRVKARRPTAARS